MKKVLFILLAAISSVAFSQNTQGKMDDASRIRMTAYVSSDLGFSHEVQKQLTNKLNSILTKNGLAGSKNQRFIITANADVVSEDIVVTTKELYQYQLEVHFVIGDGIEGTKFAMCSQTVKGLGETKAAAYIAAIKKINNSDPKFQSFVNDAKAKIIEYYNSKCDFIINEAQMLSDKSDYDQAMYKLSSVPDVCKDCYDKCLDAVPPIYQKKIDKDGASKLAEAQAIWSAGQDVDAANRVAEILSSIDPQSSSYSAAKSLMDKVSARVKSLDDREWNFQMQQQKDKVALQKAQIKAMRDIGVAYGNHQQPTTYNIRTWW